MTQYPTERDPAGLPTESSVPTPVDPLGHDREPSPSRGGTADTAKEQAGQVKDTAVSAGQDVAATAKDEAGHVVGEAKHQAASLLDQAKTEAGSQAGSQQQRVAGLLSGYADELRAMASGEESSGPVTDLVRRGGDKAREYASWLEDREPADVLDEIRTFARRRPAAFLIGAALAGVVVGRATRGFAANAKADQPTSTGPSDRARSASLVEPVPSAGDAYTGVETTGTIAGSDPLGSSYDPLDRPGSGQDDVIR